MIKQSLQHLLENKMTYVQHFLFAFRQGVICVKAGFYLICHAFIPALFSKTGSSLVSSLNKSFTNRNNEH
jgi:hypothetical protein